MFVIETVIVFVPNPKPETFPLFTQPSSLSIPPQVFYYLATRKLVWRRCKR